MPSERPHRILLVEDDAPTRNHLAQAIAAHPDLEVIGSARTCAEARQMLANEHPDVLVADLGLPDGSGIGLIREVTRNTPGSLAMVISVFGDERSLIEAIEAGATGYLLKSTPVDEVPEAILNLLRGGSPISAPIARYLLRRFSRAGAPAPASLAEDPAVAPAESAAPGFTQRELEVLRLVARGFQFTEIANLLGITTHTVSSHVRHLYQKLDVHSRGAAVHEAIQLGLINL